MLDNKFKFNFWPSFADLMLSLVLVVLIILFVVSRMLGAGNENLDRARQSQEGIQKQIQTKLGDSYSLAVISEAGDAESAVVAQASKSDVTIVNRLDRQTITFSDKILFDSGRSYLKEAGYDVLKLVGPVIADNLANISELQIQGHADIVDTDEYNMRLASERAIAVYHYLQKDIGIDPAQHLMSATTFGKYKPVDRETGKEYSRAQLEQANATYELKAKNRRIEIVIFFKNALATPK